MKLPQNLLKSSSLFKIGLTCTIIGSALDILQANLWMRIDSMFTGEHVYTDLNLLPFVLIFECMVLFIPVTLGVIVLILFLHDQLRKGWLTPRNGILSGMITWTLGSILFCLLLILADSFPQEHPLFSLNYWSFRTFLPGIIIACLMGGGVGHVLTKKILFTPPPPTDVLSLSPASQSQAAPSKHR